MTDFEDMAVGDRDAFGRCVVMRDEVIAFARAYDPQAFHLDDAAAAANPIFGRLAASGWHSAAIAMRMMVDRWSEIGAISVGGAGVDELRWLKPVYPGDTLRLETEILATRPSRSHPEWGAVTVRITMLNQDDAPVMRMATTGFFITRAGREELSSPS